jgi:hypothetical protein
MRPAFNLFGASLLPDLPLAEEIVSSEERRR